MLYIRQILIVIVNLYSIRILLNVLNVEDYGIYTVISGVVALFSFLQGTMISATQRFFSFALGTKNNTKINSTFSVNLLIYIVIAIIAVALLETIGLWFVSNHLNIPSDRVKAAVWVYHFATFTFFSSLLSTPFMAIIIAHEDMQIYAYTSIVEVCLKLIVVIILPFIILDKLILYSLLLFVISIIVAFIYIVTCFIKYDECQLKIIYWDVDLLKQITNFTSWTLFGQISVVIRRQGLTILLNQRFDPVTVAARGIAMSVANQVNMFSNNFNMGLYPAIIKSYAFKKYDEMFDLIFLGSKGTFFLMWFFFLPLFIELNTILKIWLNIVPENTLLFTRLVLIETLINSTCLPLISAARAPGRMRLYELTMGTVNFLILPCSWGFLVLGFKAYIVFIIAILANLIMFVIRLVIVEKLINLSVRSYLINVIKPTILVMVFSSILPIIFYLSFNNKVLSSILVFVSSVVSVLISMYFIGLNNVEREMVKIKTSYFINKFKKS